MPKTRKKVVKIVYKEEGDSEAGDFSDSGSEAVISQSSSSEDEDDQEVSNLSNNRKKTTKTKAQRPKKSEFAKKFVSKLSKQSKWSPEDEDVDPEPKFSIKDLTDANKLLPSILNLSDSDTDSSDDDTPRTSTMSSTLNITNTEDDYNVDTCSEYKDVWSQNLKQCEEIAKNAFLELEQHRSRLEETKQSIENYKMKNINTKESDVKHLLALGEEVKPITPIKSNKKKHVKRKNDSDSDMEDWEEVAENKAAPQQGIQLVVGFPDMACRKTKQIDKEMMIKRKINRVKKEYQVYMHKVHVLCWIGHGNYISNVLNDQDVMSTALSLVPSKECYPSERVDLKYITQITTWYKDKLSLKLDKHEGKYRPKAPPLKNLLLDQIKSRTVTSKKYFVFIFVSMLRAVGLQCRIMLNFTTLPLKPPSSELCSLSTKLNQPDSIKKQDEQQNLNKCKKTVGKKVNKDKIPQLDGTNDRYFENIMQLDGNDDPPTRITKKYLRLKTKQEGPVTETEDLSPPKRSRRILSLKKNNLSPENQEQSREIVSNRGNDKVKTEQKRGTRKSISLKKNPPGEINQDSNDEDVKPTRSQFKKLSLRKTNNSNSTKETEDSTIVKQEKNISELPLITVTNSDASTKVASKYFDKNDQTTQNQRTNRSRKRSHTSNPSTQNVGTNDNDQKIKKSRAKSAPGKSTDKSKYFDDNVKEECIAIINNSKLVPKKTKATNIKEDAKRISHRDLVNKKVDPKSDVTKDLVDIIKKRVNEAKVQPKKGKTSHTSDEDSDYLPELTEHQKTQPGTSKIKAKPGPSRKIDRRVFSTDDEAVHQNNNKIDAWCEVFVEELEQWVAVDVINAKVHCANEIYNKATHPVAYVVGWDNNNYLKDLTRRYVPHWNTITRKQRVEPAWWLTAIQLWLGPKTPRDKEEDDKLDRMQLEAPLPKSIAEYKNHPLYALKRHLLKFEAIYPPDAATLGFVRGEPVYARECVYTCRSRDTWLKEAKVVKLGEKPYKVVKARPKWDKLSNTMITDKPLEVFGLWQVQDYEPPCAENGIVPRNAYGNVELFKECMLPKGTVHIKLPGLNRVAKKLNIDCAPAMTGFDFNGGWSHPVYDGFVVCEEYEDIITNAWHEDQEDQRRREQEKAEARVYGNWKRLIANLVIRERLEHKYKFSESATSQINKSVKNTSKGPRLPLKKKCLDK